MPLPCLVVRLLAVGTMVLTAGAAAGQNYPNKPVRMVTHGVGGGADFVARLIAPALTDSLGRQVVVDNRPHGVIPGEITSKAPPDGYTLLLASSPLWIAALLQNTPYDPLRDFSPITFAATSPHVLVVSSSVAVKSVKELIALARARPGALNYSSGSTGSSTHLAAELFKALAGVNIVRIPYKTGTAQITDVISGEVQLSFGIAGSVAGHVKSGRLRALAVTSPQPSALFPDLPTVAATLPGFESGSLYGMFAPAKTPAAVINRLNRETVRVLNRADVKEKFLNVGAEVVGSSPQEFAATIRSEMARMGKVIRDAGIRVE